jgi:dihydropteroate synthase
MTAGFWDCGRNSLSLARPLVMGIVNITPDSFSDGGQFVEARAAIAHAEQLVRDGADILDLGAESSRPGAASLSVEEELCRLLPVLREAVRLGIPVSVDTTKPEVMRAGLEAGAAIVNDINALRAPGAIEVVASSDCGVCLMQMRGTPQTMQDDPRYVDVVAEVRSMLLERVALAEQAGIAKERICIDPGFGFGKRTEHNLALLRATSGFVATGYPVLVGVSRKGMIARLTSRMNEPDAAPAQRVVGSVVAALYCVQQGAQVVRVHDVRETVDALAVWREATAHAGFESGTV